VVGRNFCLRLTTASAQFLRLSDRFFIYNCQVLSFSFSLFMHGVFLESKKAEDCPKQKADHTALIADSMEKPDPDRSC